MSQSTNSAQSAANDDDMKKEAKQAIALYSKRGLGAQGSTQAYNETSQKYEQYVGSFSYTAPAQAAKAIGDLYPDMSQRSRVRILDIAAGTGLAGVEMQKLGFRNLDALDPSQGMLDVAAERGIYGRFYTDYISDAKLPIAESAYDAIVTAGGMGENHIPCSALHEMVRLVKPGGYIVNVTRAAPLEKVVDYIRCLGQLNERLEQEGAWRQLSRTTFPDYMQGVEGLMLVHQVLKGR